MPSKRSKTPVSKPLPRPQLTTKELRINVYGLLSDAVEEGVAYGYHRAFKHTEHPEEEVVIRAVSDAVMSELSELFLFDDLGE